MILRERVDLEEGLREKEAISIYTGKYGRKLIVLGMGGLSIYK